MEKRPSFVEALRQTRILRPPKHSLSTFGSTGVRYVLLSGLTDLPERCRIREGEVKAERPKILTPDIWKERFQGFGENASDYQEAFEQSYGDAFRGLEYSFRNELRNTSLEQAPLAEVTERTLKVMENEDAARTALLQGPDGSWPLSIMKFIVDISLRSFPANMRELDERGMFDPAGRREAATRAEIEKLFLEAQRNPSAVKKLGERLKETGLFSHYEDRFFALVSSHR